MKKTIYLLAFIFMTVIVFSCAKKLDNNTKLRSSLTGQLKVQGGWTVRVTFKAGHDAGALCMVPYQGDFMATLGNWVHIPCVGSGTNCTWTVGYTTNVSYDSVEYNTTYAATATLSEYDKRSEAEFVMPARSLLMQDSTTATSIGVSESDIGIWINVSEQTWNRIDSTHYGLDNGIEFDTIPKYLP